MEPSEIEPDEYGVYTALCRTTLFRFGIGRMRFKDHTGEDTFSEEAKLDFSRAGTS